MSTAAELILADIDDDAEQIARLLRLAREMATGWLAGKELLEGDRAEIEAVIEGAKAIAERQRSTIERLGRKGAA